VVVGACLDLESARNFLTACDPGSTTLTGKTWVLDESGKIKVERIVSIAIPLRLV
jgi:hypothetical protein